MESYENHMTKWPVRRLLAGPSLPNGSHKLKSCRIKRITEQERRDLLYRANQRLMNLDFVAAQFGYPDVISAEMPLTALVQSKHELSVTVEAPNELEAYRKAEEAADKYLGALAFAVGIQRYRFYPSVANKLPGAGGSDTRNYMSTGLAQVTLYESKRLPTKDVDYAEALLDLGGKD